MHRKAGIAPPQPVVIVVEKLKSCGHTAYIAGGAVRDMIIDQRRPVDWDIATSATPAEVSSCFEHVVPTGLAHGTVTVIEEGMSIEVTTYRHDGPYVDGRRPEHVAFLDDIAADLARRDFTINAMAFDPTTGELVDPYGGVSDIEARLIRCVGDPAERFSEDKLRMLRAVRFAATLGFSVDSSVVDAARALAPGIVQVSVERIMDELVKTVRAPKPGAALVLMEDMGLAPYILPELCCEVGEEERKALYAACDRLHPEPKERFAALLSPLGPNGARIALARMRVSNQFSITVSRIIEGAQNLGQNPSDYELRLTASRVGQDCLLPAVRLNRALCRQGTGSLAVADLGSEGIEAVESLEERAGSVLAAKPALRIADLDISGKEVMEATGLSQGPRVRIVLQRLLDQVLHDPSANKKECLLEMATGIAEEMEQELA